MRRSYALPEKFATDKVWISEIFRCSCRKTTCHRRTLSATCDRIQIVFDDFISLQEIARCVDGFKIYGSTEVVAWVPMPGEVFIELPKDQDDPFVFYTIEIRHFEHNTIRKVFAITEHRADLFRAIIK